MRSELEAVHGERLQRVLTREDAQVERLQRREKDLEVAAFQHRQHILAESARLQARQQEFLKTHELESQKITANEERLKYVRKES